MSRLIFTLILLLSSSAALAYIGPGMGAGPLAALGVGAGQPDRSEIWKLEGVK